MAKSSLSFTLKVFLVLTNSVVYAFKKKPAVVIEPPPEPTWIPLIVAAILFSLATTMVWVFSRPPKVLQPQPKYAPNMAKSGSGNLLFNPVVVKDDAAGVSAALCEMICAEAVHKIERSGRFVLAVAGGSCLDSLAGLPKAALDWSQVVLVYANHKCVPITTEKATHAKALKKFATKLGMKIIAPHPSPKEGSDGSAEATFYMKALQDAGVTTPDLVVLGLGEDGHVGSLHPNSKALECKDKTVVASPKAGEPSSITMSMSMFNSASRVVVVATGAKKKEAVDRALRRKKDPPGTFPAQSLIHPVFIVDKDASSAIQD